MSTARAGRSTKVSRRAVLYASTAALGAAGLAAAAWPFIDQLNPDAGTRASGDVIELDLASLRPAEPRALHWHGLPIFVVRRTAAMIDALRDERLLARMSDPKSEKRQQPAYAANWHRSIDPAVSVLVGVCTYCACVPQFIAQASPPMIRRAAMSAQAARLISMPPAGLISDRRSTIFRCRRTRSPTSRGW
jgi:ubiquinol-cytochrome c reductase iron-sulfur subunit